MREHPKRVPPDWKTRGEKRMAGKIEEMARKLEQAGYTVDADPKARVIAVKVVTSNPWDEAARIASILGLQIDLDNPEADDADRCVHQAWNPDNPEEAYTITAGVCGAAYWEPDEEAIIIQA